MGIGTAAVAVVAAAVLAGAPAAAPAPATFTRTVAVQACGPGSGHWVSIALATGKPGGIRYVLVELTDPAHVTRAAGDCRHPDPAVQRGRGGAKAGSPGVIRPVS